MELCDDLHKFCQTLTRHRFPFDKNDIPGNGIYVLFEDGENGHGGERIVRIGTHTGNNQLRSRLKQHFINENKDRSIFRKNIGRAILNSRNDPFLKYWEYDLTSRKNRELYQSKVDFKKQQDIERDVSVYIQKNFSFVVFKANDKDQRLDLESKIISTVSLCKNCSSSENWLGVHSPKEKIRESGLWIVNELYKKPLCESEIDILRG